MFEIVNFVNNETLKMWILWKMRFWKCEFYQNCDFENVNFVKNNILKMWILWFKSLVYFSGFLNTLFGIISACDQKKMKLVQSSQNCKIIDQSLAI